MCLPPTCAMQQIPRNAQELQQLQMNKSSSKALRRTSRSIDQREAEFTTFLFQHALRHRIFCLYNKSPCADMSPVLKEKSEQKLTQHDPHDAWSLTGLSAPDPLQSTVVGSMCSGTLGLCIIACLPSRGNEGLALPWLGSMVARNSSLCQSANLLMARLCV